MAISSYILTADGLLALAILIGLVLGSDLKQFLLSTPELASNADLDAYRRVVARNMYGTLAVIALTGAAVLVIALGLALRSISWWELHFVLVFGGGFGAVGARGKLIEAKARGIAVNSDELRTERDRTVHTWLKKALPDW